MRTQPAITEPRSQTGAACPYAASLSSRYNPFEPEFRDNPYPFFAEARREAPVCYNPTFDAWLVTGYEETLTILKDPRRFSSLRAMEPTVPLHPDVLAVLAEGYPMVPTLFDNDPPGHTRSRSLFSAAFTPRRVAQMEPGIRALAHSLVDRFVDAGQADMLGEFAYPLPMTVIADLMGIPRSDMPRIKSWNNDWVELYAPGELPRHRECARSVVAYHAYCTALIEERRANPRDDLITALVEARLEGEAPFSTAEIVWQMMFAIAAGHETTTDLIGNMLVLLLRHPSQWQALQADPALIPAAIEETLRFDGTIQRAPRVTTEPVELGGVMLPRGARLYALFGSANRDETAFDAAEQFNIHRAPSAQRHLGFGWGIHYCVGAALARLEGRVAMEVLCERLPNLRLAPGFVPEYRPSFIFRGLASLPMIWDVPEVR